MSDKFSKEKRSEIMRNVKSSGNKSTEQKIVSFFKKNNIVGWRRNFSLYGRPDIVFPRLRLAIFLDGCFWHGHICRKKAPMNNAEYWCKKIAKNIERDINVTSKLKSKNWIVLRIWECQLKDNKYLQDISDEYRLKVS